MFQGDVFSDVPFLKGRSAGDTAEDPNLVIERRTVAVLGYRCDVYHGGRRVEVQAIAPVVDARKAGIPPNWDGAYSYFPLPDLIGEGTLYADYYPARRSRHHRCLSLARGGGLAAVVRSPRR